MCYFKGGLPVSVKQKWEESLTTQLLQRGQNHQAQGTQAHKMLTQP